MQVDRDAESLGALEDRPEEGVVEVAAPGVPVDQRADEAVPANHSVQLFGGGLRRRRRQRREPGQPIGAAPDRLRERVVRLPGQGHRLVRSELLHARRGEGEHLHVDARRVHPRDPPLAEIAEVLHELRVARRHLGMVPSLLDPGHEVPPRTFEKRARSVVLLQRDHPHHRPPQVI